MFSKAYKDGQKNLKEWNKALKSGSPIAFFGAGGFCKTLLKCLRPYKFIIDNDIKKNCTFLENILILHPLSLSFSYENSIAVISVCSQTIDYQELYDCAKNLGFKTIIPGIAIHILLQKNRTFFGYSDPDYLYSHRYFLEKTYDIFHLTDAQSRLSYSTEVRHRLSLNFQNVNNPVFPQYFIPEIKLLYENEVFVDGGAYDGDTIRSYPGVLGKCIAYEPDPENAKTLREMHAEVEVIELGLSDRFGSMNFSGGKGLMSCIDEEGEIRVCTAPLDAWNVTFLKLDIEGYELNALKGALKILRKARPVIAVAIYHKPHDIYEIPLWLKENLPQDYVFMCRPHGHFGFDFVFYAIPVERVATVQYE